MKFLLLITMLIFSVSSFANDKCIVDFKLSGSGEEVKESVCLLVGAAQSEDYKDLYSDCNCVSKKPTAKLKGSTEPESRCAAPRTYEVDLNTGEIKVQVEVDPQ